MNEQGKRERETLLSRSITPSRQRNPSMPLLSSLSTAAILLFAAHCGVWAATPFQGPLRFCPSCKGLQGTGRPAGGALAPGEPCGVYTRSCARGLRCVPPPRELSPLQALLQGRGVCAKHSRISPTDRPRPTGRGSGCVCVFVCVLLRWINLQLVEQQNNTAISDAAVFCPQVLSRHTVMTSKE